MHCITFSGVSESFPDAHALVDAAVAEAPVRLLVGSQAGASYARMSDRARYRLILIELGTECLGVHTGEHAGEEGGNALGFARFRLGRGRPTDLVEIVHQPATSPELLQEAMELFECYGLRTAVCADFPGRIVNRLLRPYLNAALERLDSKLASAADLDLTLKLGLGYPEGPIGLLETTGLAEHHDVTKALYAALGEPAFWPARRAYVAKMRVTGGMPCNR